MGRGSGKVTYLKIAACVLIAVGVLVYCSGAAVLPGRNAPPVTQRPAVVPDSGRDTEVTFEQAMPTFKTVNEGGITRYWFAYGTEDGLVHVCHLPKQMAEGKYTRGAWKATFAAYDVEVRSRGSKKNIHEYIVDFLWDYPFVSPPPRGKYVQVIVVNGKETRFINERSVQEPAAQPPPPSTMAQAEPLPMPSAPPSFAQPPYPSAPPFFPPSWGGSSGGGSSHDQANKNAAALGKIQQDAKDAADKNTAALKKLQQQAEENAPVYYHCINCGATITKSKSSSSPSSRDGGPCSSDGRFGFGHSWERSRN